MARKKVKRVERGWGGHFIGAFNCKFRRNTLLTCGEQRFVISTVGAYEPAAADGLVPIGAFGRFYETMVFVALSDGTYWDIDPEKIVEMDAKQTLCYQNVNKLPRNVDLLANDMHEVVVAELTKEME